MENIKLFEAIPNFSEGRDNTVIKYICNAIESVENVKILNCDMGYDANRTVITFVGGENEIEQAAFNAIKAASEKIDMRIQKGEHPRIGATDVMPFVPLHGATIKDAILIARRLSQRVANELKIPVYCYEKAAFSENKKNLFNCRLGEYEGIKEKLKLSEWKPDFGSDIYSSQVEKSGITVIGARDFLLAVNFNLQTSNVSIAKEIARKVRHSGYINDGIRIHGTLEGAKAIGWHMEEYGFAQVSMNIVDINKTPLHQAFLEVVKIAQEFGTKVTGTEIIGMLPKKALIDAGNHFNNDKNHLSEIEMIELAIYKMGFNQIEKFNYEERIIEFAIKRRT